MLHRTVLVFCFVFLCLMGDVMIQEVCMYFNPNTVTSSSVVKSVYKVLERHKMVNNDTLTSYFATFKRD